MRETRCRHRKDSQAAGSVAGGERGQNCGGVFVVSAATLEQPPGDREPEPRQVPEPGTPVMDLARKKVGRVMDTPWGTKVALRPEGGGTEWDAELDKVRPVSTSELLSPRVAEANRRSQGAL